VQEVATLGWLQHDWRGLIAHLNYDIATES
jgi:hypothetical protein